VTRRPGQEMRAGGPAPPGVTEDDLAFARAFERLAIAGDSFGHEDHVRLGWVCLRLAPLPEAAARFIRMLKAFAAHHGVPEKYHDTITWAYLLLLHDRLTTMPEAHTWRELAERNPDLLCYRPSILARYYRKETLASERARTGFVMPDAWLEEGRRTARAPAEPSEITPTPQTADRGAVQETTETLFRTTDTSKRD